MKAVVIFSFLLTVFCAAPAFTAENSVSVATFHGTGNGVTQTVRLQGGPATFYVQLNWEKPDPELRENEGTFAVKLQDREKTYSDLIIGTIDHFDGSRTVVVPRDGTYLLAVTAPGPWTIEIKQ